MKGRIFRVVSLCAALLLLPACGNDAASMTVVTGIGLDGLPGSRHIVAEAVQLGQEQETNHSILLYSSGASLGDSIDRTVAMTGRPLHCNHTQVLVLGRETAEAGLEEITRDLLRWSQYPVSLQLLVAKETAAQLMAARPVITDLGSTELARMIQRGASQAESPAVSVSQFYREAYDPGIEAILPLAQLRQNGEDETREILGAALFRGMNMIAALEREDSRTLLWLRGQSGGTLAVGAGQLEIARLTRRIRADERGARLELNISVKADALEARESDIHTQAEEAMTAQCAALLTQLRTLRCDAVGVGSAVRRQCPALWERAGEDWPAYFEAYPVTVSVRVTDVVWGRALAGARVND